MGFVRPPVRINRSHPLYQRGLVLAIAPGMPGYPAFIRRGNLATTGYVNSARSSAGLAGSGLSGPTNAYWGGSSASNTFTFNQNEGTVLLHFQTNFAPTDGADHTFFCIGPNNYPTGPSFDILKYGDNNWYCGWWSGSDTRVSVSATGTFTSGVPTTIAVTWNKTTGLTGTRLYTNGILRGTNTTSPSTGSTAGSVFALGMAQSLTNFPFFNGGGIIYSFIVLDKAITADEIANFNANPTTIFDAPTRRVKTRTLATMLQAALASWGWNGNAPAFEQEQHITATTGILGWVGNAASINAQSLLQAPSAAWQWIGNAAGGFGSNSQLGGMVYGAVRAIVRRGTYGAVNRRGVRNNK
jgi:hypothetical protein